MRNVLAAFKSFNDISSTKQVHSNLQQSKNKDNFTTNGKNSYNVPAFLYKCEGRMEKNAQYKIMRNVRVKV
jgi:hypothetical protein